MSLASGTVFVWGQSGELGVPVDAESTCPFATPVRGLPPVVQVDCGESITAAVTVDGHLFVWGRGARLGLGHEGVAASPTRVQGALLDRAVVAVSCGESHCGVITRDGLAFLWGVGTRGALGDGDEAVHRTMEPSAPLGLPDPPVALSCGYLATAVVTRSGSLFVFGSNEFGKLGLGAEVRCAPRPTLLASIPDPVAQVCLGSVYGACVTTTQRLYTWGFGRSGALGLGDRRSRPEPHLVPCPEPIVSVACTRGQINFDTKGNLEGKEAPHTFAVAASGSVYAMGTCHKGMLGNLTKKSLSPAGCDELTPYRLGGPGRDAPGAAPTGYFQGMKATQAVSSSIHSAVLADASVFTFGCGSGGRMGVRKFMEGLTGGRSRMKCYISEPTPVEGLAGKHVLMVSSSRRHMTALVKD
jgi:alpha-tubulin suppressor-like RCC1 family protein